MPLLLETSAISATSPYPPTDFFVHAEQREGCRSGSVRHRGRLRSQSHSVELVPTTTGTGRRLLLDVCLRFVGISLLLLQTLLRSLVRRRSGDISIDRTGVRSLLQAARTLLLSQLSHAIFQLLTGQRAHLLPVLPRRGPCPAH